MVKTASIMAVSIPPAIFKKWTLDKKLFLYNVSPCYTLRGQSSSPAIHQSTPVPLLASCLCRSETSWAATHQKQNASTLAYLNTQFINYILHAALLYHCHTTEKLQKLCIFCCITHRFLLRSRLSV